ncbi:probable palmitoyltransferase ZDHHC19 isoform X2 [Heterocephalus glaber]|uniref:Palmitoyltransferase n=1 Tax=Heterocephalus glaber TaxID=10181 RepID=A0AAX6SPV4_HETGA|nr:probable palmitoyltransferase ZDHHC19 isoform X2 [Heterocephalus glaber]
MSHMKGPQPPPLISFSWFLLSLLPAFNVVLLVVFSGLFFAFPWLVQNGEWAVPAITGPLFVLTFFSLISLNFSDPGTLHQGSLKEDPMLVHVVWVNHRAFCLRWCPSCCFHRPPRTHHCPWCNICVEDFDHHCKWVNNCIGHRNFRCFMLLIVSLFLYSSALLVISLVFLTRTSHLPFNLDKAMALVVAVPAAGFLLPLLLLLVSQVLSVSTAERSCKGQCRDLQGYNPFDQGCTRNWYLALCVPLGSPYMSDAVWLQRPVGPKGPPVPAPSPPAVPLHSLSPTLSGEGGALQEVTFPGPSSVEWEGGTRGCMAPSSPAVPLEFRPGLDEVSSVLWGCPPAGLASQASVNHSPVPPGSQQEEAAPPTSPQPDQQCSDLKLASASYLCPL